MSTRRFTRFTNAFSKKWENHWASVALWYCWYNFGRVRKSLRVTPAVAAGIADHVWSARTTRGRMSDRISRMENTNPHDGPNPLLIEICETLKRYEYAYRDLRADLAGLKSLLREDQMEPFRQARDRDIHDLGNAFALETRVHLLDAAIERLHGT